MNVNDHKVRSLVIETTCDIATMLTEKDWGDTRSGMYVEDGDGNSSHFSEEAQDIFNQHYDVVEEKINGSEKFGSPRLERIGPVSKISTKK